MTLKLSNRSDIASFRALENLRAVNLRVAAGEDIIRLEAGQPCFGAPEGVLEYARQQLIDNPIQGYTDAVGTVALRERIAQHYQTFYGAHVHPDHVTVATGSSSGFILAFTAIFNPGDKVGLINPSYAAYRNILKALDLQVVDIEARAEDDYQPTCDLLEEFGGDLDGLIINSPANPAGTIINENELKRICEWAHNNNVRLISDEAYHGITYCEKSQTAWAYNQDAIILNTFSKYFALTGWRMGWVVAPKDVSARMKKLSENLFVSPPTISQAAAWKVFDHYKELDTYVEAYQANRDILKTALPDAGLDKLSAANGAFYIYADVSAYSNDSEAFTKDLLNSAGVSCTSGLDFDPHRGHQTIRISYAGSATDMQEACRRIKQHLKG